MKCKRLLKGEESDCMDNYQEINVSKKESIKIAGVNAPIFFALVVVLLIAIYMEILPENFAAGIFVAMVLGALFNWIGDQIPIFKTMGGGSILCILLPALLIYLNVFPASLETVTDEFYNDVGFSDFVVPGIIVGSLLSMNRKMLLKIGVKFFIPLLGAVTVTMVVGGFVGQIMGFGFMDTLFFVVGPIMGGGMAAGGVPMSEIYSAAGVGDAGEVLAQIAPAIMVGNILTILAAGVLNGLGKRKNMPSNFSGEGEMLRKKDENEEEYTDDSNTLPFSIQSLGVGILVTGAIYIFGLILENLIPGDLHYYVWIILSAAALKMFNLLPRFVEKAAEDWYDMITEAWVPAILVSISAGMVDFSEVIKIVLNPTYITLAVVTVIIAALAAGFIGLMVGFYFIESSIGAGLGMADMGGSGDVAVLSAAERMGLMPFLQIASRIGGAFMIVVLSVLTSLFM